MTIGGGAPVAVQSMTLTKTYDVEATVGQIAALASAGCEVVRCAVPKTEDAQALKLIVHRVRERIPIYLAAVGPKNLELTGEIADGWLAVFFSPEHAHESLDALRTGRARAGHDGLAGFDVVPTVPLVVGDDVPAAVDAVRGYAALYVGGMGSRAQNFYNAQARRMGFDRAAAEVQEKYLARDYTGAQAAVPFEFIDQTSLLGPLDRIADRMKAYAEAGVTTLTLSPLAAGLDERIAALRTAVDALERSGST